jgi:YbgC/YbaW family acyl-CoA thioester hydrolase
VPVEHRYRRRVQFYETDLAGIVHFSWYYRYMEEAEHALWRASGLSIADPSSGVGFPRVAAACDFAAPLHFEDDIEVHVRIAELGRRKIRYECTIRRGDVVVATGTMTSVCVAKTATPPRAIEIPEAIAAALRDPL